MPHISLAFRDPLHVPLFPDGLSIERQCFANEQQTEINMAALARAISRATGTEIDVESLSAILIFSGIGLLLTLVAIAAYGLDLSYGFL